MEKELFIQLDSGAEVEMFNQAALTNKALQFANGAAYSYVVLVGTGGSFPRRCSARAITSRTWSASGRA